MTSSPYVSRSQSCFFTEVRPDSPPQIRNLIPETQNSGSACLAVVQVLSESWTAVASSWAGEAESAVYLSAAVKLVKGDGRQWAHLSQSSPASVIHGSWGPVVVARAGQGGCHQLGDCYSGPQGLLSVQ